jgi:hypothetical protein
MEADAIESASIVLFPHPIPSETSRIFPEMRLSTVLMCASYKLPWIVAGFRESYIGDCRFRPLAREPYFTIAPKGSRNGQASSRQISNFVWSF